MAEVSVEHGVRGGGEGGGAGEGPGGGAAEGGGCHGHDGDNGDGNTDDVAIGGEWAVAAGREGGGGGGCDAGDDGVGPPGVTGDDGEEGGGDGEEEDGDDDGGGGGAADEDAGDDDGDDDGDDGAVTMVDSVVVADIPLSNYERQRVPATRDDVAPGSARWTVRRGDSVAVHLSRSTPPPRRGGRGRWHPFVVPWSAGEVVDIRRRRHGHHDHDHVGDGETSNGDGDDGGDGGGGGGAGADMERFALTLTIRWYYRRGDLAPGARAGLPRPARPSRPSGDGDGRHNRVVDFEEVWRSDEITEVGASSLLGPATVITTTLTTGPAMHPGVTDQCDRRDRDRDVFPDIFLACRGCYDVGRGAVVTASAAGAAAGVGPAVPRSAAGGGASMATAAGGGAGDGGKRLGPRPPDPDRGGGPGCGGRRGVAPMDKVGGSGSSSSSSSSAENGDPDADNPVLLPLLLEESIVVPLVVPYSISADRPEVEDDPKEEGGGGGGMAEAEAEAAAGGCWSVRPGDAVAVHMVRSTPPNVPHVAAAAAAAGGGNDPTSEPHRRRTKTKNGNRNKWHPFSVPWSPAEVVRIVRRGRGERVADDGGGRHDGGDASSSSPPVVEVRWLYRTGDVPRNASGWKEIERSHEGEGPPPPPPHGAEEVLRSNHVDEVEPSSLLGPVRLLPPPPPATSSGGGGGGGGDGDGATIHPPDGAPAAAAPHRRHHPPRIPLVWCRRSYDVDGNAVAPIATPEMGAAAASNETGAGRCRPPDEDGVAASSPPETAGDGRDRRPSGRVAAPEVPDGCGGGGGGGRGGRVHLESAAVRDPPFSNCDLPPPRDVPPRPAGAGAGAGAGAEGAEAERWTVRCGDAVAVHVVEASTPPRRRRTTREEKKEKKNRWHPFLVPWNPAEVVRIWREGGGAAITTTGDGDGGGGGGGGGGTLMVEVRWLYRRGEIPADAFSSSSSSSSSSAEESSRGGENTALPDDAADEEVWMSNHTDVLELSSLLGPARLLLLSGGSADPPPPATVGRWSRIFPDVILACRQFYDRDSNRVTSINGGLSVNGRERVEPTMPDIEVVAGPGGEDIGGSGDGPGDVRSKVAPAAAPCSAAGGGWVDPARRGGRIHRDSIVIRDPPFSNYDDFSPPPPGGASRTDWTVRTGDAVAVHLEGSTKPSSRRRRPDGGSGRSEWHPFTVPWSPGEVVEIIATEGDDGASGKNGPDVGGGTEEEAPGGGTVSESGIGRYTVRVRWLFRRSEVPKDARSKRRSDGGATIIFPGAVSPGPPDVEEVLRSNEVDDVEASSLLGPVRLILPGGSSETISSSSCPSSSVNVGSSSVGSIFPDVPLSCRQFYDKDDNAVKPIQEWAGNEEEETNRAASKEGESKKRKHDDDTAAAKNSGETPSGAPPPSTFVSMPCEGRVDKSKQRRIYHDRIVVHNPPVSNYRTPPPASSIPDGEERKWSISCGDAVAVHSDTDTEDSVPPIYLSVDGDRLRKGYGGKWHPFRVGWSPAEVEKIWFRPKKRPPPTSSGDGNTSEGRGPVSDDVGDIDRSRVVDGVDGKFMVRVRWLYRRGHLPKNLRRKFAPMPPALLSEREEVFRSNHFDTVELSSLLGPAILLDPSSLGGTAAVSSPAVSSSPDVEQPSSVSFLPSVVLMWSQFYDRDRSEVKLIHECSSSTGTEQDGSGGPGAADGRDRQKDRRDSKKRGHPPPDEETAPRRVDSSSAAAEEHAPPSGTTTFPSPPIWTEDSSPRHHRTFYRSIVVHNPPFSNYETRPASTGEGEVVDWPLRCGDTVAVHLEDSSPPTGRAGDEDGDGEAGKKNVWHPFTVPWSPAEIVTMWREHLVAGGDASKKRRKSKQDRGKHERDSRVMMEVRWLYRKGDLERGALAEEYSPARASDLEVVYESNFFQNVEVSSLLGPIQLQFSHSVTGQGGVSSSIFPEVMLRWGGYYRTQDHKVYNFETKSMDELIKRGRDASEVLKTHKPLRRLLTEAELQIGSGDTKKRNDDENASVGTHDDDGSAKSVNLIPFDKDSRNSLQVKTPDDPVYVDIASGKAYYLHARLKPHFPAFATLRESDASELLKTSEFLWTVRVGDVVNLHYDYDDWKRDAKEGREYNWYPFHAVWSPAEVLAIWRNVSREEGARLRQQGNNSECVSKNGDDGKDDADHGNGQLMLEVRWMYTKELLPIDALSETSDQLEEVFETDHVQPIKADCLLSPCRLSAKSTGTFPSDMRFKDNGVPEPEFYCHRFWSVHRKALVPCGSLAHRAERGMVHSREYSKNHALKYAVEEALRKEPQHVETPTSGQVEVSHYDDDARCAKLHDGRKHENGKEMRKLLADAASAFSLSSAAYDANSKGVPLQGRENEHRKIAEFLRSAIRSTRGTLFCAGPPGTGKTASVKSIIAQLRDEQANGKLPDFAFVAINGMELRHPFDAYVSFWEAIKEDKLSPGAAAACLENHFGDHQSSKHTEEQVATADRPVTVLLLDEIDYLVTNKQTLLYNLFSWPMQAGRNGLVVIGISNTLNLPERLHPRVQSRLGKERCMFHSYGVKDIVNILKTRLSLGKNGPCNRVFEDDAITFAARKTAVKSGDIRRAFQMCRSAAEAVLSEIDSGTRPPSSERGGGHMVRILDMQKTTRAKLDSPLLSAVTMSTTFEALVLVSLASLRSQSGRERGSSGVHELLDKMQGVASALGDPKYLPIPTFNELLEMLTRMGEGRLLLLRTPKMSHVWPLIELNMDEFDLHVALKNTPHQKLADKNLCSHNF